LTLPRSYRKFQQDRWHLFITKVCFDSNIFFWVHVHVLNIDLQRYPFSTLNHLISYLVHSFFQWMISAKSDSVTKTLKNYFF